MTITTLLFYYDPHFTTETREVKLLIQKAQPVEIWTSVLCLLSPHAINTEQSIASHQQVESGSHPLAENIQEALWD